MYNSDNCDLSQGLKENNLAQGELPGCGGAKCGAAKPDARAAKKGAAPDSTRSPKFVKIKEKKLRNKKTVEYARKTVAAGALGADLEGGELPFRPMSERTLERMCDCLTWMKMAAPEDYGKFKKTEGYACRVAFCPSCAAFQSRRDGLKLSAMMDAMQDLVNVYVPGRYDAATYDLPHVIRAACEGVEFALVTLTTPNVKGPDLKAEESRFAKGFNDMVRLWLARSFGEHYLGYARKLEVTYNRQKIITREMWEGAGKYSSPWKWKLKRLGLKVGDRNPFFDTYNPHYHVILAVTPGFFRADGDGAEVPVLREETLLDKWRELMGDPSITQVKIQKAYKSRGEGNGATAELSKYVAKDADYLYSPKVFRTFYEGLKGCKRLTFGGIFREFHRLFKDDKLARYVPVDETDYKWEIEYYWLGRLYSEKDRVTLTSAKADKIRGMKYSETYDTEDF